MTQSLQTFGADPWQTRGVRIRAIVPETEGVATYTLVEDSATAAGQYAFVPGQFNMLYLPGVGESAISMSGDPAGQHEWIHTVRVAGNVTRTLAGLEPGAMLGLRGPFGTGWPMAALTGQDVVLVAGGLGLAPLRPLIYHLLRHRSNYRTASLILGARTSAGLLYASEYEDWQRLGLELHITVDRATPDWHGHLGVVTTILDRLPLMDADQTQILTCGPEVMMKYVALAALRRGVPPENLWLSLERNMQCAAGLCGHCQLGPAFICRDGPVLRYDRLAPYLFVEAL